MGLISSKKPDESPKKPELRFPVLPQDFFIVMRIALENTPWEPDDAPQVKRATDNLLQLAKFTADVNKVRAKSADQPPDQPVESATSPELEPEPPTATAPEQKKKKPTASGPLKRGSKAKGGSNAHGD